MSRAQAVSGAAGRKALRKVLAALAAGGKIVARSLDGDDAAGLNAAPFVVRRAGAGCGRAVAVIQPVMEHLQQSGLVERAGPDIWRISAAGASWLRRALSQGDGFLDQHISAEVKTLAGPDEAGKVTVNGAESPLAWLRGRKDKTGRAMISDTQFAAGERLRRDFTFAGLSPRMTAAWNGPSGAGGRRSSGQGGQAQLLDQVLDARQRYNDALAAVGPELSGLLVDVCCFLHGLEGVESAKGWPRRSGKVILQIALDRLARHYGIQPAQGVAARGNAIRHWGAQDYRPEIT